MNPPAALSLARFHDDCNWTEAFNFASKPAHVDPSRAAKGPELPFGLDDVDSICLAVEGANDEADWVCLGLLKDGRWFVLSAWCDYTGWGCRDGGDAAIADTYADAITLGLTDDQRRRLGIVLDSDVSSVCPVHSLTTPPT